METGYLFETTTRTLPCGDLFAQPGNQPPAITESENLVWEPSEAMRQEFPYAPIHGASYRGDGAVLLHRLSAALGEH